MDFNHMNKKKLPYIVIYIIGCCINPLDEWVKWLFYSTQKRFLSIRISELTPQDLDDYMEELDQLQMAELFLRYKRRECNKVQHNLVFNYMRDHSVEQLMERKMNKEELTRAKRLLDELKTLSSSEIKNYIEEKNSDYSNLSKVDAYVLHYISIYNYQRTSEEATNKIIDLNKRKELNLRKSLHKDYGYFPKK